MTARVIVAGADDGARAPAVEAAALAGARVVGVVAFDTLAERVAMQVGLESLVVELRGIAPDLLDDALDAVAELRETSMFEARLVLCFDVSQIDPVAARFDGPDVQLLCEPSLADRVAAIGIAARPRGSRLADTARESEQERLKRLDEDVARIADALARLTGRDPLAEQRRGNGLAPSDRSLREGAVVYAPPPRQPASGDMEAAARVRNVIKARRMRAQFFDGDLFADPAWDMLLDLYAARFEHQRVSVSSLCIAAAVPPTTALRWIATLSEAGLFAREADPADKRRAFIALTPRALEGLRAYFDAVDRAGLGVP